MILYAVTIFLSAFLLFQVQPLISKFILPWFGGSPAVWTAAMLRRSMPVRRGLQTRPPLASKPVTRRT